MLRWGIVGTGFISNEVIRAIKESDGSTLEMIAGRNPDRLHEMQTAHEIPRQSLGYETLMREPNVDVVYVGTPNHSHHTLTIEAARHGKPVLSEKSLTTTMDQAQALETAVRAHGTFFVEGLMYLAHPVYRKLTEVLADGRLGELRAIEGSYAANIWQVTNPAGRGTIYNLGCYPVSLMHLVVQAMCGPHAFADRQMAGFGLASSRDGTVRDALVSVRLANGVLATLKSTDGYGMSHAFSITGEKGVLRFRTNPWLPVAGRNHLEWLPFKGTPEDIVIEDPHDAFYHQIKMVETALAAGVTEVARPSPRLADSVEIMAFLTEWEALCLASLEWKDDRKT